MDACAGARHQARARRRSVTNIGTDAGWGALRSPTSAPHAVVHPRGTAPHHPRPSRSTCRADAVVARFLDLRHSRERRHCGRVRVRRRSMSRGHAQDAGATTAVPQRVTRAIVVGSKAKPTCVRLGDPRSLGSASGSPSSPRLGGASDARASLVAFGAAPVIMPAPAQRTDVRLRLRSGVATLERLAHRFCRHLEAPRDLTVRHPASAHLHSHVVVDLHAPRGGPAGEPPPGSER